MTMNNLVGFLWVGLVVILFIGMIYDTNHNKDDQDEN